MKLSIDLDDKGIQFLREAVIVAPQAVARSINRAATSARMEFKRIVKDNYNIKPNDLGRGKTLDSVVSIIPANKDTLTAILRASDKAIAITKFKGTKAGAKGVQYQFKKGGTTYTNAEAFIATTQSGHRGVFVRLSTGKHRVKRTSPSTGLPYLSELPIDQLWGPSIHQILGGKATFKAIETKFLAEFKKNLAHELDYLHITIKE
jgi:hypothetical protein